MKGKKRPEIIEEAGPPPVTENLTPFGIGMEARKLRGACRRTRTLPPKEIRSTSTEKEAEPLDSPIAASLPGRLSPLPSSSAQPPPPRAGAYIYGAAGCSCSVWSSLHRRTGGGRGVKLTGWVAAPPAEPSPVCFGLDLLRTHPLSPRIPVGPPVIDRGWRPGRAMGFT